MKDEDCIFCKLASHEIPTNIVYEDENVLAFDDMEPLMPVHTLIIPKNHYRDIADNVPEEELGRLFATVRKVADIKGVSEDGFRLLVNTGENASQSVKHLHIHMLGGGLMPRPNDQDWGTSATNADEIAAKKAGRE